MSGDTDRPLCVLAHGHTETGEPRHKPATIGLLCGHHRRRLDQHAHEIQALIIDSRRIIDGGAPMESGPQGKRPKKPANAPAPGDVLLMSLFDPRTKAVKLRPSEANEFGDPSEPVPAVTSVVASWLMEVADKRPLTTVLPRSVLAQLDVLVRHHDWIAAHDWVTDYMLELAELRKALRTAVHDVTHRRIGWCDLPYRDRTRCGGALIVENGQDGVRCATCRETWTTPEEQARLAMRLE